MTGQNKRRVTPRRLIAAGATAATSLLVLSPVAAYSMPFGTALSAPHLGAGAANAVLPVASQGGEGGEGGEGAKAKSSEAVEILTAAWLIAGHLKSGAVLYEQGQKNMAVTHMKHPGDEIYADLADHLKERGIPGFADELSDLATSVENDAGADAVAAAHAAVSAKLHEVIEGLDASDGDELRAIVKLMRTAAEEYELGVKDGQIVNLHEYQDAWGFLQVAMDQARHLADPDEPEAVRIVASEVLEQIATTQSSFDTMAPQGKIEGDASALFGAAARAELAALKLK